MTRKLRVPKKRQTTTARNTRDTQPQPRYLLKQERLGPKLSPARKPRSAKRAYPAHSRNLVAPAAHAKRERAAKSAERLSRRYAPRAKGSNAPVRGSGESAKLPAPRAGIPQRSVKATSPGAVAKRAKPVKNMKCVPSPPVPRAMPQSGMPFCEASILIQYFVPATTWNGVER